MNKILQKGFTLIELLIALVILGILVAIAYPSYSQYILRTHRADALSTLAQDQVLLERCYSQTFSYSGACASLPNFPQTSNQGYYTINLSNLSTSSYTLTAVPKGNQTKDTTCANFTVNQANVRTASDNSGNAQTSCWNM